MEHLQEDIQREISQLKTVCFKLKSQIRKVKPIVKDFRDLLQYKPLFQKSSFLYLNVLAGQIRNQIVREFQSQLLQTDEAIRQMKISNQNTQNQNNETLYEAFKKVQQTNRTNDQIKMRQASLDKEIVQLKHQLYIEQQNIQERAKIDYVQQIVERIDQMTPIDSFEKLNQELNRLPSEDLVSKISDQMEQLNHQMTGYISEDQLNTRLEDIQKKFLAGLQQYTKEFSEKLKNLYQICGGQFQKQKLINKKFKEAFDAINNTFNSKPWIADINPVISENAEKLSISVFEDFKSFNNPRIDRLQSQFKESQKKLQEFNRILERNDEILLDKASKTDCKYLKDLCSSKLPQTAFTDQTKIFQSRIFKLETIVNQQKKALESSSGELQLFYSSYTAFKKDIQTFYSLYSNLIDIKELIANKADRSDLVSIVSSYSKREDTDSLKSSVEILHKQLELMNVLVLATVGSMLKTADSAASKDRYRTDLYKNFKALYNWVANSVPPQSEKRSKHRNIVSISMDRHPIDHSDSSEFFLPTLRHHKHSRNLSVTIPRKKVKSSFELPYI